MRYKLPESLGSREAEAVGPVTGATVEVVLVDTPPLVRADAAEKEQP